MTQLEKKDSYWLHAMKDITAGTAGGISLVSAGHPLDTIKVRLQTQKTVNGLLQFSGPMDCAKKTWMNEGLSGFYKGVSSPLIGVPPIYAIVFGVYSSTKRLLHSSSDHNTLVPLEKIFLAGCITGIATTVITTPIELLKSRLQIQYLQPSANKPQYSGLLDCGRQLIARQGLPGLFRGTVVTLWRDVPGSGAYFLSYEFFHRRLVKSDHTIFENTAAILFSGGMGGILNWLTVFPLDVIKSRIQTANEGNYRPGTSGMIQCANELIKENGIKALFKGLSPALIRGFIANAFCFTGYEFARKLLNII